MKNKSPILQLFNLFPSPWLALPLSGAWKSPWWRYGYYNVQAFQFVFFAMPDADHRHVR